MERADKAQDRSTQHQPAARFVSGPAAAPAFVDRSARGAQLTAMVQMMQRSPQVAELGSLVQMMQTSPQVTAQLALNARLAAGATAVTQRVEGEEEELLQGKFAPAQRVEGDEEELLQGKFVTVQRFEGEDEEPLQGKFAPIQRVAAETAPAPSPNQTGLPDGLKSGIESLSGISLDQVRVHYNSSQPAQLSAHAYAQGSEIHLAPGQERHLPHEAWHVVQQAQGRVKPTMQLKDGVPINDDAGLEREADVMGAKAASAVSMAGPSGNVQRRVESVETHHQREPVGGHSENGPLNFLSPALAQFATAQRQAADASHLLKQDRFASVVQREPIIPAGMEPSRHIEPEQAEDFESLLKSFVLVPEELLDLFSNVLDDEEKESTLVKYQTLLNILCVCSREGQEAVDAFQNLGAGTEKLAAFGRIAELIDLHVGPLVQEQKQSVIASAEPTAYFDEPFLYVEFFNKPTKTPRQIRASLLRHGLWLMKESHPEDKNSLWLPWVQSELVADGCELGVMLAKVKEWHGSGKVYKTKSGRSYEVDGVKHFFPVEGPGVVPLDRKQYLTLRAIILLFESNCGSAVRECSGAKQLLDSLQGSVPSEISSCLAQIAESGATTTDSLVDSLLTEYIKPYNCGSMTNMLLELANEIRLIKEYGANRERRIKEKKKYVEGQERMKNQPK